MSATPTDYAKLRAELAKDAQRLTDFGHHGSAVLVQHAADALAALQADARRLRAGLDAISRMKTPEAMRDTARALAQQEQTK